MKKVKMKEKNVDNYVVITSSVLLLIVGVVWGIIISSNSTFALETSTSGNATNGNATSGNATSGNATSGNATSGNATSGNATNSNVIKNDNVLFLVDLYFKSTNVKAGDKIEITKITSGACNTAMILYFRGQNTNVPFSVEVESLNNNPYFIVPLNVITDKYLLEEVAIIGLNSDNSTFVKKVTRKENEGNEVLNFKELDLSVENSAAKYIEIYDLKFDSKSVKVGESVGFSYDTTENNSITGINFEFVSSDNNSFSVFANPSVDGKVKIPSTVKPGNYVLSKFEFITNKSRIIYNKGKDFNFDISLDVIANDKKTYMYNADDINDKVINDIHDSSNDAIINIDGSVNSFISSDLFNSIKGTEKQLVIDYNGNQIVFCGNDIVNPKAIDVSIATNNLLSDSEVSKMVDDGVVINFKSNGSLPGKALVKIKRTREMTTLFGDSNIYVYYYDDVKKAFNVIAENVSVKDDYYQFTISHNSKFIMTTKKLDDSLIVEDDSNVVGFQNSTTSNLMIVGIGILLIIVVFALIFVLKGDENKKHKRRDRGGKNE